MRARPSSDAALPGAPPPGSRLAEVAARRDRARRDRTLGGFLGLVAALALLGGALDLLAIPLDRLPGVAGRMAEVLATRYWPPRLSHVAERGYLRAVFDTLQMSLVASALGMALAVPLAWVAAFNVSPARRLGHPLARLLLTAFRSVHEMIWTILLVTVLGFGMLAGTLALTIFCAGFAGKLFAEAVEGIDPGPVEAMRAAGAGPLQLFFWAVLPQVRVAWTSIAIYTWDLVFRSATVVGFFGAGGMGSYLRESVQRIESQEVAAILLTIVAVVLAAELLSGWARDRLARAVA
jgi:phosphonate transport system permease protein